MKPACSDFVNEKREYGNNPRQIGKIRGDKNDDKTGTVKWARQDSNLGPSGYEPPALPLSYEPAE